MPWVWEGGHGLSLIFQNGLSVFIADFSATASGLPRSNYRNHLANLLRALSHGNFRGAVTHHPIPPKHDQGMHKAPIRDLPFSGK
jgi:hypothetical protein